MKTKMNQKYVIIGFVLIIAGIIVNTFFNRGVSIQGDGSVSKEEAAGFLSTLVEEVVYVYEKPSAIFKTQTEKMKIGEEEVEVTVLTDYDEKVKEIFSENGIKQLENMKFGGKKYINKENGKVYVMDIIGIKNKVLNSSLQIKNVQVNNSSTLIKGTANFYKAGTDDKDIINYYYLIKNVRLVRVDNTFYVDSFIYSND